jgi:serine phosphatase RsbU (regulator of sigma subunit)
MTSSLRRGLAVAIAQVARQMQAQGSEQETLQSMVELAVATIPGCEHAGVTILDDTIETPAASDEIPPRVDRLQYDAGEGPCLDAMRDHDVLVVDDLEAEDRWPSFSRRAAAETGIRSMLSFRLFLDEGTLGALNLYSRRRNAFDDDAVLAGGVFAAHAAVALEAARQRERTVALESDIEGRRRQTRWYARQAELAAALQQSLLTELPDLAPLEVAARYVPATEAAEVGGDWYDVFHLPGGSIALAVGDLAGHDIDAAVAMGQTRSDLRALAVDRREPPGQILGRLDAVLAHLHPGRSGTCVYGELTQHDGGWRALLANAGHLPPLQLTEDGVKYLEARPEPLFGAGVETARTTFAVDLPPHSTLLLYTDGLIERRDRGLDTMLAELQAVVTELRDQPLDQLCDELLARFAAEPSDDVCLLAVRVPDLEVGRTGQPNGRAPH